MNTNIHRRPQRRLCLPLLLVALLWASCINLQHVSDYATASNTQLDNYNAIGYTFSQACNDACDLEALRTLQLETPHCNCSADTAADSITTVIYKTLHTYFDGLAKLSDKNTGNYKMTDLSKNLQAGKYGSVTISPEQADASTKLAGLLTNFIAGHKKQKKIRAYIGQADSAVQVLLGALAFNLRDNLGGKLRVQQGYLQDIYLDMANDTTATQWQRTHAIQDYRGAIQAAKKKIAELEVYAKGLDQLAKGHHKLYEEKEKLTLDECKATLSIYAGQISDLSAAFRKLKND